MVDFFASGTILCALPVCCSVFCCSAASKRNWLWIYFPIFFCAERVALLAKAGHDWIDGKPCNLAAGCPARSDSHWLRLWQVEFYSSVCWIVLFYSFGFCRVDPFTVVRYCVFAYCPHLARKTVSLVMLLTGAFGPRVSSPFGANVLRSGWKTDRRAFMTLGLLYILGRVLTPG